MTFRMFMSVSMSELVSEFVSVSELRQSHLLYSMKTAGVCWNSSFSLL